MSSTKSGIRWGALGLLALFFGAFLTTIVPIPRASAAASSSTIKLSWIDYDTINLTHGYGDTYAGMIGLAAEQGDYTMTKVDGEKHYYTPDGATPGGCTPEIEVTFAGGSPWHDSYAQGEVKLKGHDANGGSNCTEIVKHEQPIANGKKGYYTRFNWVDAATLEPTGILDLSGKNGDEKVPDGTFVKTADGSKFVQTPPGTCPSYLQDVTTSTATLYGWTGESGSCNDHYDKTSINLGNTANQTKAAGTGTATEHKTAELTNDTSTETATCETSAGILSWIVCPFIYMAAHAVDGVYKYLIEPMLHTTPLPLDSTSPNFQVWSTFRTLGDIFLVIALLVIVFGQSLGGGLIDAYSAKKILPRLLAAAVLINISYYIVAFAIDVSNILGHGIQSLILTPFKVAKDGIRVGDGSIGLGVTAAIATAFAATTETAGAVVGAVGAAVGITTLGSLLPLFLLFVVLPAVLIVIAILGVIILRQGLIIFLVLSSPVAFALYCLPNTEKYFHKWWELLTKTLLVYPIISVLFALANVLAITVTNSNAKGLVGALGPIVAIVALFVPLFLIPFAFKLAGGVLGRLHDVMAGLGKRATEGVKGNQQDPLSLRNQAKNKARGGITRARAQAFRNWNANDKINSGRVGRAGGFLLGNAIEREALLQQAAKARGSAVKDNGDDVLLNARTSFMGKDENGNDQRYDLNGNKVTDMAYRTSLQQYPNLADAMFSSDYRSTKVNSTEEALAFTDRFAAMASQEGMSLQETQGMFTALGFARQNERGEWKHGKWTQDPATKQFKFTPVGEDSMYTGTDEGEASRKSSGNFVHEQYHKKGAFDASRAFSSQFIAMRKVKQQHINEVKRVEALKKAGTATQKDLDSGAYARDELRKVVEFQDAIGRNAGSRDPQTGEQIVGISGASAATQAAYKELNDMDEPSLPQGQAGPAVYTEDQQIVAQLRNEIKGGETWEKRNNEGRAAPRS